MWPLCIYFISKFQSPLSIYFSVLRSPNWVSATGLRFFLESTKVGAFKMSSRFILSIFSCLLLLGQSNAEAESLEEPTNILSTAYDELQRKGFPSGLLPNSVANYSFDNSSGHFSVQLQRRCDIILPPDNYPASFSEEIRGRLTEGYIQDLSGIRVRVFFTWWSITGIRSSGKDLVFEVGVGSAKYPSSNFDESPDCEGSSHTSSWANGDVIKAQLPSP